MPFGTWKQRKKCQCRCQVGVRPWSGALFMVCVLDRPRSKLENDNEHEHEHDLRRGKKIHWQLFDTGNSLTLPQPWIPFNASHEDGDLDNRSARRRRALFTGRRSRAVRVLLWTDSAGTRNGNLDRRRYFQPNRTRPAKHRCGSSRLRPGDEGRGQNDRVFNGFGQFRRNESGVRQVLPRRFPADELLPAQFREKLRHIFVPIR